SQTIDEVREIAYNLRPYQIDRIGLTKALESMLKNIARSTEIDLSFEIDRIDDLFTKETDINLYRIVQECVNNLIKHSGASKAKVIIKRDDRSLNAVIQDDGKGFVPESLVSANSTRSGFGLMGIAERTKMLGGRHEIRSVPGRGTIVSVTID